MDNGMRLATERDIPELCEIWKVCFCDNEDYVRFFYRENLDRITTTVYTIDNRPVSMLHWFDATFVNGSDRKPAKYLYAGGSLPEYRRNGYYGAVIKYVTDYAEQNGCVLFGKPATQRLIPYYRTFGFISDACFKLVTVDPGEKIPVNVRPLSAEEYNRMRNQAFSPHPHVEWPDRYVQYCIAESEFFGGKTVAIETDGSDHFLMGVPKEDTFLITETDLSVSQLKKVSGALCAMFKTELIKAYMPDYSCEEGEEIVSSVVCNGPLNNTYVNLLLI